MWQEGQVVIGAGADTTANALTLLHFHILDNTDILKKLRKELEDAIPDKFAPVELRVVEKLPYLVSCSNGYRKKKKIVADCLPL